MTELNRPVTRKTTRSFMHYKTPIVAQLMPGDVIILRLWGHRRRTVWSLHELYFAGVRRDILSERRAKKKARTRKTPS